MATSKSTPKKKVAAKLPAKKLKSQPSKKAVKKTNNKKTLDKTTRSKATPLTPKKVTANSARADAKKITSKKPSVKNPATQKSTTKTISAKADPKKTPKARPAVAAQKSLLAAKKTLKNLQPTSPSIEAAEKPKKAASKKEDSMIMSAMTEIVPPAAREHIKAHLQTVRMPEFKSRPIAHVNAEGQPHADVGGKTRYSPEELKEFEELILEKLASARLEFRELKEAINRGGEEGTDGTSGIHAKVLEDGAETAEKENLNQLAARQLKYVSNLENALIRIKSGTYGICSVTGKLIPKERLIAVPHTTQSIEAKMMRSD